MITKKDGSTISVQDAVLNVLQNESTDRMGSIELLEYKVATYETVLSNLIATLHERGLIDDIAVLVDIIPGSPYFISDKD